jgi:hypothetical protein
MGASLSWRLSLLLAAMILAGCSTGPRRMKVWGSVSYEGKPVNQGTIAFVPIDENGGPSTGASITAGKYEIAEAAGPRAGGTYRIELQAVRATGATEPNPKDPSAPLAVFEPIFPPKYNSASVLKRTISSDPTQNQFDFRLPE